MERSTGPAKPIRAECGGVPVYGYGGAFVYGVSPDFVPGIEPQEHAPAPVRKIRPKKSWQIESNLLGASPPRLPRTELNDGQPQLAIRLIDGDPETYWSSRAQNQPDVEPAWIRIDLARESEVGRIVLVPRADGRGLPLELEIRTSRDAWHWDTVVQGPLASPAGDAPAAPSDDGRHLNYAMRIEAASAGGAGSIVFDFAPRPLKQVWIVAGRLTPLYCGMFHFSLAEVQVLDASGANLALVSRGAGATVSSTNYGFQSQRELHEALWPTFYDVGVTWVRCAYFGDILNWHGVEQEKGVYRIDERAEAALEECRSYGMKVVLGLGHTNWLYAPGGRPPAQAKQLWLTQEPPYGSLNGARGTLPATTIPGMREGFEAYVRHVVRHFKGRIPYYEIWNEENVCWNDESECQCPRYFPSPEVYAEWFRAAHRIIREEDPGAKVVLGGMCPSVYCTTDTEFLERLFALGLAPLVDVIAWHGPFIAATPDRSDYAQTRIFERMVERVKALAAANGFRGEYHINEWGANAPYPFPTGQFPRHSELVKAKYAARWSLVYHKHGIMHSWCEPWNEQETWDIGWFRNTFSADPTSPQQPQAVYYVLRTLCTVLEAVQPQQIEASWSNRTARIYPVGLRAKNGDRLLAVWLQERATDAGCAERTSLTVEAGDAVRATAFDVLNGTEQALRIVRKDGRITIPDLVLRDWPIVIRLGRGA